MDAVSPSAQGVLTAELEVLALRALRKACESINGTYFDWKLRPALLELSDATSRLGCWHRGHRTIEIARHLLTSHPWGVVIEVLKHELAHQFVDEVLQVAGEAAHGPAFREVCAALGVDPRPVGVPVGSDDAMRAEERIIERVGKLLSLATSNNAHEAQAAMAAAQKLMLKHNLESVASNEQRNYSFRHLGTPTGRVSAAQRRLAVILDEHFFVEVIWIPVWRVLEGKRGSVMEVCGTRENLDLAEYVHDFLMGTVDRLWREYKQEYGLQRNSGRQAFQAGVMDGFLSKLKAERDQSRQRGLVWIGDPRLSQFYRKRYPHVRKTRGGSVRGRMEFHEGAAMGRNIVLHRGVSGRATGRSTPLLG